MVFASYTHQAFSTRSYNTCMAFFQNSDATC